MDISQNKSEFIDLMINFNGEINKILDMSVNSKNIEKLREAYLGKYSKDRFREYFVKKTALHITFKYIYIRMASESQNIVKAKFNDEAITNWKDLSKNYRQDYHMLYELACKDLRRAEETREIFEPCIYDDYTNELQISVFNKEENNYLDRLKYYDFKTLDPQTAVSLFDVLYPSEDRDKLQGFIQESKVTTELMKSLGLI